MRDTLGFDSRGGDVRVLQTMLNALGARLVVDGIFGDDTFDAVCDFQTVKRLEPDGVVGPKTWLALDQALARRDYETAELEKDRLKMAGERAVARALELWALDIFDPAGDDKSPEAQTSRDFITQFITRGLGWTWEPPYAGDGDFKWCLAFAADCWREIQAQLRVLYWGSTYRMDRYASYRSAFGEPNVGKGRLYQKVTPDTRAKDLAWKPRAGDIALINGANYGTHGVLIVALDEKHDILETVEGNAFGRGPHGERQQGVVKQRRPLSIVRRIIRPSVEDLQ